MNVIESIDILYQFGVDDFIRFRRSRTAIDSILTTLADIFSSGPGLVDFSSEKNLVVYELNPNTNSRARTWLRRTYDRNKSHTVLYTAGAQFPESDIKIFAEDIVNGTLYDALTTTRGSEEMKEQLKKLSARQHNLLGDLLGNLRSTIITP